MKRPPVVEIASFAVGLLIYAAIFMPPFVRIFATGGAEPLVGPIVLCADRELSSAVAARLGKVACRGS